MQVPTTTRDKFKEECRKNNVSMTEIIVSAMEQYSGVVTTNELLTKTNELIALLTDGKKKKKKKGK